MGEGGEGKGGLGWCGERSIWSNVPVSPCPPSGPLEGEEHEGHVDEDTMNLLQNILVVTKT